VAVNRRQLLLALASAAPLGVAGLLCPRRTFFLPPRGGWAVETTDRGVIDWPGTYWEPISASAVDRDIVVVYRYDIDFAYGSSIESFELKLKPGALKT
jgi:hypothetical protein